MWFATAGPIETSHPLIMPRLRNPSQRLAPSSSLTPHGSIVQSFADLPTR